MTKQLTRIIFKRTNRSVVIGLMALVLLMGSVMKSVAMEQIRMVVLPFYVEEGLDSNDAGDATMHYRRMMKFINNQLVRHGYEVINPFAADSSEEEYNRVMERTREDSPLAAKQMSKKYGTDAAYIVWLNVKMNQTPDGYCKASARVDGEGYDSGGRDLGVGLSKTFKITKRDCDDSVAEVEKEVGDLVARKLTAWSGPGTNAVSGNYDSDSNAGGALQRNITKLNNTINVRLDGGTDYELVEAFGKIVNTATGVYEAKRYRSEIVPDNPAASTVLWRLKVENTDPFRLQSNIMTMINQVLDSGGELTLRNVPYRYTPGEIDLLKGVRPGSSSSRELQFVVDRERARDNEFSGRHDPYQAKGVSTVRKGFE